MSLRSIPSRRRLIRSVGPTNSVMRPIRSHRCWSAEFEDYVQLDSYENDSQCSVHTSAALTELESLLDSNPPEAAVHEFFERHPRFLPEAGFLHNGIHDDVVISKMPLHNDFVTDFAYVNVNSQYARVICLEIERPGLKLFTRDGEFTSEFTRARQQILDWNLWAQHNVKDALKYFGRYGQHLLGPHNHVSLHSILIVGRRSQLTTRKRRERWAAEGAIMPRSVDIMTYDRLLENAAREWERPPNKKILVCAYRDRALRVKHVTS